MTMPKPLIAAVLLAVIGCGWTAAGAVRLDAETMKAALHTDSREDDGFIEDVLDRMNNANRPANQRLPRSMVYGTFRWAREKPRRQFKYFKWGLTERAKRIGVKL